MTATTLAAPVQDAGHADCSVTHQLRLGLEYLTANRLDDAIAAFQRGLLSVAHEPSGSVSTGTVAELHEKLGNACMLRGDLEPAADNYKAALRLAPHLTACWCNLGNVQLKLAKPEEAVQLYVQALTLNPGHWPSRTNLVQALTATRQYLLAKVLLGELLDERPQDPQLHNRLGKLHFEIGELDAALKCFRQAVALDPRDSDSIYWIGGIKQQMGDIQAAEAAYAEAAQLQPLIRRPAAVFPAHFRVLALYAPFAGNMPTGYLFKDTVYDTDTLAVLANSDYDVELLKQGVQVVVNLVSDADQAEVLLPLAADLVDRFGKPVVNDPRKIQRTTRDGVTALLEGMAGCRIPKLLRQKAGSDLAISTLQATLPSSPAVLVRPVGTHGGDDFEKIDGPAALAAALAQPPQTDRYFIEYIDYRSVDGYFRKYRFIFVNDEILPYHLAISDDWKVHHDSTDMADHQSMQEEEEAFLSDPTTVFNADHYRIFRAIRERMGLEYFGIDCGLDRSGNLVLFEANASMLIHEHNEEFPYKTPFVHRIKQAFDEMLRKLAETTVN
jgi:Flp pilus assembly protein TadD/glutathione synthase/RimK-type ligase-like ATP-grasp enzyme